MSKKSNESVEAPGAETQTFSVVKVREMVKNDLHAALLLLDAVYRDPATLEALSDFIYGRYQNAQHKKELDNQTKLNV